MTALLLLLAYILPLPIMAACFYYHVFSSMGSFLTQLVAIGVVSLAPSAILMLVVLKRVLHFIFNILCITAVLSVLQHFNLLHLAKH
ncbi:MAG: hypothetical protein HY052_04715 [Proteobacteria bacterium]|nr:hypothetical protein [Pseudomonadota bacterium]